MMNYTHLDECDYDLISHENLNELEANEKITINNRLYSILSIYEWIIERSNNIDPLRNVVSNEDKNCIIEAYKFLFSTSKEKNRIIAEIKERYKKKIYVNFLNLKNW